MNDRTLRTVAWAAAGAAVLIGLVLTAYTARRLVTARSVAVRRLAVLAELRDMARDSDVSERALRAFEAAAERRVTPLDELIGRVLPDVEPDDTHDLGEDVLPGWRMDRKELSFRQVELAQVMAFVQEAERPLAPVDGPALPHWRMAKCVVRAAPDLAGSGQVDLILEALTRAEP